MQRIGLSATQNPLEEVGRFLVGPKRTCTVVDTGVRKPLDLQVHVPVESMVEPDADIELDPFEGTGMEATRKSIWPAIYPKLLELVKEHRSTLIFVNSRRGAERLALRLNELAQEPIARAHHGSLAREERLVVEDLLKAGELPCLVATSSLELGIDMGAIDLVLQVESPKSVTAGLQRIGRAGHNVGDVSKGRIFPKFRGDLLECAVVAQRMREGRIESTVVPRNALDVLAQQIVAMAASAGDDGLSVDDLYALVTRTYSYGELGREQLENVLDMLDGRYPSEEFGELRARIVWDRVAGTIRPRKGARGLAITNAGTIPDRGLYSVNLPDGRRVGELDEEMVYEARPGQTFLLGASSWRIEEITRDRVIVSPAPGVPAAVPFWKGDGLGRPKELGQAIGAFARWAVDQEPSTLTAEYHLDELAAGNLVEFLREQQAATRVIPSDRTIVIERFRDEIGDWRLCILSPYGGRVHATWGLALSARIREQFGLESDAIWSDDGIIVHLPDADEPPGAELVMIEPDELEDLVVGELGGSALFGARFRENAGRALLIPRAYPGKRTPLWQQRLKSQSLLEVAKRYGQFPIVLETYRECLRDVLDVPGLHELLRSLHSRELTLVEVETPTASPFASSLLFDYVATYMYEGDTPNAERRAAALALDRDLLRELLGQDELRELIDPGALEQVEADLQRLSERTRADSLDALHDVLRRLGDLTEAELHERGGTAEWIEQLESERRAVRLRVGGEPRWIAAEDAGLYRDALGSVPPSGLPEVFLEDVPDAMERLVRRFARTHGPFEAGVLKQRYGLDLTPVLAGLERAGELVRGELRPGGTQREWCDPEVLRRLRRASLAALRKEIEPADQRALARFMPSWQGVDRHPASGAGIDRLRDVLVPLQGLALPVDVWERDVLPRRVGAYSPSWLDQLCSAGEIVWVGAGSLGRRSGRVALYFREDAALLGAPPAPPAPEGGVHDALRARLAQGACFFSDLLTDVPGMPTEELVEALWDLVWAGEVTNDAWAPLRSPKLTAAAPWSQKARAERRRSFSARRRGAQPTVQGRWSLTEALFRSERSGGPAPRPGRAAARALRHRHARAGAGRGHPGRLLLALRLAGGAGDDRRRPPRLLHRGPRRRAVRAARRGRAAALAARRRRRAAARAGRHRSGAALRRRFEVAEAGRPVSGPHRGRLRRAGRRRARALRRAQRQGPAVPRRRRTTSGSRPASRRWSTPCGAAACASWRSSGSTASRWSARPTRPRCSTSASEPGRASSRSAPDAEVCDAVAGPDRQAHLALHAAAMDAPAQLDHRAAAVLLARVEPPVRCDPGLLHRRHADHDVVVGDRGADAEHRHLRVEVADLAAARRDLELGIRALGLARVAADVVRRGPALRPRDGDLARRARSRLRADDRLQAHARPPLRQREDHVGALAQDRRRGRLLPPAARAPLDRHIPAVRYAARAHRGEDRIAAECALRDRQRELQRRAHHEALHR